MEQLGSHWTDFYKILYLSIFRKIIEKMEVSQIFNKNNGTSHDDQRTFFLSYLSQFRLE